MEYLTIQTVAAGIRCSPEEEEGEDRIQLHYLDSRVVFIDKIPTYLFSPKTMLNFCFSLFTINGLHLLLVF